MALELHHTHSWNLTPREAAALQRELAGLVAETSLPAPPQTVGGVDMSIRGGVVQAAAVVLRLPDLELVEQAVWRGPVSFPYVPGLLSFRETPAVLAALERLTLLPDAILADAHGKAHPRRFGLACHLGILLERPVIGVAKSRLVGDYDEPDEAAGAVTPLRSGDEQIGAVVRTRTGVKPLFVSVGHRITLAEAVALTLTCTTRYRLPEPARLAHRLSNLAAG